MKKILFAVLLLSLVLAAAYTGASYWAGTLAQEQYEAAIAKTVQPNVIVSGKSYDRGVFQSTAVTLITVRAAGYGQAGEDTFRFALSNTIAHGPLARVRSGSGDQEIKPVQAVITTRLSPGPENDTTLSKILETIPELLSSELVTAIKLDGSGESFLDIPSFNKKLMNEKNREVAIEWSGLKGDTRFGSSLTDISGSFSSPALRIADSEARLTITDMSAVFAAHPGAKGISVGASTLKCGSFDFHSVEDNTRARLESPVIKAESSDSGETARGSLIAGFDKLAVNGDSFGPFVFDLELRKLDISTILLFEQNLKNLQKQLPTKSGEEIQGLFTECYTQLLTGLITKSPELELKQLKLGTPMGDVSAGLKISIGESGAALPNLLIALAGASASLEAAISEPLLSFFLENSFRADFTKKEGLGQEAAKLKAAQKAREVISTLLDQRIVIRDGDGIRSSATYQAGKLVINGRGLNLMELLR